MVKMQIISFALNLVIVVSKFTSAYIFLLSNDFSLDCNMLTLLTRLKVCLPHAHKSQ